MKEKTIWLTPWYFVVLLYLEIIFRLFCVPNFFRLSLINIILYLIPISFFLTLISRLFKKPINKGITFTIIGLLCFWFCVEFIFKRAFGVFFSISTMGFADQAAAFLEDAVKIVLSNWWGIILLFIPLIATILLRNKINFHRINGKKGLLIIGFILLSYFIFLGSLLIGKSKEYSPFELHFKVNDNSLNIQKMGVMSSTTLELKRKVFGFEETIEGNTMIPKPEEEDPEETITYNTTDIDFNALKEQEQNKILKQMHTYFSNDPGTKQNDYTGYYKGKNLIVFMAESFNEIGVNKELTPTLYKLTHESFVFENFYSPVILSTIGGEFQELTGLYPNLNMLTSKWRKGTNYYPYGFANVFQSVNYQTFAYHNNQYNFQARDKYLTSIGFTNYLGCFNGLEEKINCKQWPQSDVEMIEATMPDYLQSEDPFMVYYATVSGHMKYNWGNAMARKHKDAVANLSYSDPVKAYIATQIELDKALETLIKQLEESGKLDDTVIALVGDHYPYDLSLDEVNEAASYKKDSVVEKNRSHFILWNSKTPTTNISKVGSQIDVLPTLLNLFGVKYDSRIIIGKDILSDEPGLAMFDNRSWVSDYGTYFASTGKFELKEGKTIPSDDYIKTMNSVVSAKIIMSQRIMEYDYYRKVVK